MIKVNVIILFMNITHRLAFLEVMQTALLEAAAPIASFQDPIQAFSYQHAQDQAGEDLQVVTKDDLYWVVSPGLSQRLAQLGFELVGFECFRGISHRFINC